MAAALDGIAFGVLSDAEAVAVLSAVEDLGRRVDAARVGAAAAVGSRARNGLGHDSLAWKLGCQGQVDLITRVTRVSGREATRRLRLGDNVTDRMSGAMLLPPYYPAVAAGLTSGALGVDAADAIVTALDQVGPRVAPDDLHTAERALVASATGASTDETRGLPGEGFAFSADLVRGLAGQWQARFDPNGAAPNDSLLEPRSTIGFGRLTRGVYPLRGAVTAGLRGIRNGVFDSYLSAHAAPAFPTEEEHALIKGGELVGGTGVDWIDGVEAPVSLRSVKQLICSGGYQKIIFKENGAVLCLGGKKRFFTTAQRKAIAARDGGCIILGYRVAAHWREVHHVIPLAETRKNRHRQRSPSLLRPPPQHRHLRLAHPNDPRQTARQSANLGRHHHPATRRHPPRPTSHPPQQLNRGLDMLDHRSARGRLDVLDGDGHA